jgi:hypothetical protein
MKFYAAHDGSRVWGVGDTVERALDDAQRRISRPIAEGESRKALTLETAEITYGQFADICIVEEKPVTWPLTAS